MDSRVTWVFFYEAAAPPAGRHSHQHLLPRKQPIGAKKQQHFLFHVGETLWCEYQQRIPDTLTWFRQLFIHLPPLAEWTADTSHLRGLTVYETKLKVGVFEVSWALYFWRAKPVSLHQKQAECCRLSLKLVLLSCVRLFWSITADMSPCCHSHLHCFTH